MIKTFRGLLADGDQIKIRLSTKKGKIGYRMIKFQVMQATPGTITQESVVKIFKTIQTSIDGTVDFSDGNLLATAILIASDNANYQFTEPSIMFEQEIFNQDVFITHTDISTGEACNYYLELETISLSDNAAAVSTLRDIRLNPQVGA